MGVKSNTDATKGHTALVSTPWPTTHQCFSPCIGEDHWLYKIKDITCPLSFDLEAIRPLGPMTEPWSLTLKMPHALRILSL